MSRPPFVRKSSKGGTAARAYHRDLLARAADHCDGVVGVDPDSKCVGLCGWEERSAQPTWVASTRIKDGHGVWNVNEIYEQIFEALDVLGSSGIRRRPLVVVEAMRIRQAGDSSTKNPQSLVDLSFLGGIAAAAVKAVWPEALILPVEPAYWKGGVPKPIQHSRTLDQLGWGKEQLAGYARPHATPPDVCLLSKVRPTDWKHVMCAVGLAKWGREELGLARTLIKRRGLRS